MATMPVAADFYVTSGFGPRWGQFHWGTDFGRNGGSGGQPIYAVKDGTVIAAGPASGFGQWIRVDHPATNGGGETIYGHIIPEVVAGQRVHEGQRIGRIDPNKSTNGGVDPHLHFEWHTYSWVPHANRVSGKNIYDPMKKLAGAKPPGIVVPKSTSQKEAVKKVSTITDIAVDIDQHHRITFGRPTQLPKKVIIVHTTENSFGTPAQNILDYQVQSRSGSYHRLVDSTGKILLANTDNWQVWATGNKGNDIALHVSCVAYAKSTRDQWLAQSKMLEGVARVIAYWARTYGIPLVKLTRAELGAGKHGVAGHLEAQVWGNTTHWDPGYHFPYDVVLQRAKQINAGVSTPAAVQPPAQAPKESPKEDRTVTTLDSIRRSHVPGSTHEASLADYIMYIDRGVYDGRKMQDETHRRLEQYQKETTQNIAELKALVEKLLSEKEK